MTETHLHDATVEAAKSPFDESPDFLDGHAFGQSLGLPTRVTLTLLASVLVFLMIYSMPATHPWVGNLLILGAIVQLVTANAWIAMLVAFSSVVAGHVLIQPYQRLDPGPVLVQALLVLGYLSVSLRLAETVRFAKAFPVSPNAAQAWLSLDGLRQAVTSRWFVGPCAIMLGCWLIWRFPQNKRMEVDYGLMQAPGRLIFFLLPMFFAWFVIRMLIRVYEWYRLTPEAADIMMRSEYSNEVWAELASAEKRRAKQVRREIQKESNE